MSMPEIHELLDREVDSIDDIRRRFESSYTENYWHPRNGDWISDDYYRILDLTTQPGYLTIGEIRELGRNIKRLNDKYPIIEEKLDSPVLIEAYNEAAKQVNDINSAEVNRKDVPMMRSSSD